MSVEKSKSANYTLPLILMAILGGAIVPILQGALADSIGIQKALFIPVICYVYIVYFGYYCWRNLGHVEAGMVKGGH